MNINSIYKSILRRIIKKTFFFWQKLGINISINHYHEPLPDIKMLNEDLWNNKSELVGINIDEEVQINLLTLFLSNFKEEYDGIPKDKASVSYCYYINNYFIGPVDAEILYCMIRYFKPKKIFEIGSGNSTYLSAQAITKNKEHNNKYECELVAIDPYPNEILKAGFPGLSKLMHKEVQDVPLSEFKKLTKNDILFIDSSHVLKIGNDVQYEYLEILPRLNAGVIVHLHDIFLPAEYPREWVLKEHRFWTEQYILQAFLEFNESFEVLWAGSYMNIKHPDLLKKAFSSYKIDEKYIGSLWIRKIK
jgi:predicted O-methyltransferase YrrM